MKIDIIEPFGFCVGVEYAVNRIINIAKKEKSNVFCVNQLVHNKSVMETIEKEGIIVLRGEKEKLIDNIDNGTIVFSAHGTSQQLIDKAKNKGLKVLDLVCPFVLKEFKTIKEKIESGYSIIFIGIRGHEESNAALSISKEIYFIENENDVDNLKINNDKIATINQTTLSISNLTNIHDKIRKKYPNVEIIDEICDSTRLRQENVIKHANRYDKVIVVGDNNSNNAKSLKQMVEITNKNVFMISTKEELKKIVFCDNDKIMLCSSASTPKESVFAIYEEIIKK